MKCKTGSYTFQMKIPVAVTYSKREDGTASVDAVSVPSEDAIYAMVDAHAKQIKVGAQLRCSNLLPSEAP